MTLERGELEAASNYHEFRKLIDARRVELRMRMMDVDLDAGLQDGYFAKLVCGQRNFGPRTLGKILRALKVGISLSPTERTQ